MNKTKDILISAKALINTPAKWTKSCYARDRDGVLVGFTSDEAVCFCAEGALFRATGYVCAISPTMREHHHAYNLLDIACREVATKKGLEIRSGYCIPLVNDNRIIKHSDIMEAYDLAIERA